ncbi:MAG: hypothetical protein M0R46_11850 [Candidatus Muirbacterium halophilum]|nr:hypothetical protein [Candidatus Muirbacterium halophilum]MCK9476608.1 hypothetical protein [Candidatus Muirbacterium halophilum]
MYLFFAGLILGIIIGTNIEFLRNISTLKYFNKEKNKNVLGKFSLFEIKIKLFVLKLYEEKKIHFIVIFYCLLVSLVVFSFTAISNSSSKPGYFDKLLHIMDKINRSIEMDWGR